MASVLPSQGQPNLTYVVLSDGELADLRKLLKGIDAPLAKALRTQSKAAKQ